MTPEKHSAPLTLFERVFLDVMQRRDPSRRYHLAEYPADSAPASAANERNDGEPGNRLPASSADVSS